jgi:hypothetical protein
MLKRFLALFLAIFFVLSMFASCVDPNADSEETTVEETTVEEILNSMEEKYNAPREVIKEDVEKILTKLRSIDALEE